MDLTRDLTVEDLAGGAVLEKLNYELGRVIENIADINMDITKPREVICKIKFTPNSKRTQADILITTDSKLAPMETYPAHVFITEDEAGKPKAVEAVMHETDMFDHTGKVTNISRGMKE